MIDVDMGNGKDGETSLAALEAEHGPLPKTRESRTGSGGRHLFFRYLADREIRNKQNIMPGLDVRGEGGYVVIPPSVHETGQTYVWISTLEPDHCPDPMLTVYPRTIRSFRGTCRSRLRPQ